MRVLILGSNGSLGRYLAEEFAEYKPLCWTRRDFDIRDIEIISEKICSVNPDVILNAIAYNNVDACETSEGEEQAFKINGEGVGWLAQAAQQAGAVLVHFSTDYVFDGSKTDGYAEKDKPLPISRYGQSKFLGEKLLESNWNRYYLVRVSRLFGEKGISQNSKKNFVDVMFDLAKIQRRIEVVDDEVSKPTYGKDVAKGVYSLIRGAHPFGIYHFVNEGAVSWYDFALKIFETKLRVQNCRPPKQMDSVEKWQSDGCELAVMPNVVPVASGRFSRPAKRPPYSILLNSKFPIFRRYDEALAEYLAERK